MKVLAVDTSTKFISLGLTDGDSFIAEHTVDMEEGHLERLILVIEEVLRAVHWEVNDIQLFVVGVGPGSFTGLRIGVTVTKGLAYSLKRPIVGIPTIDVLAYNIQFADKLICPILNAKNERVYTAIYYSEKDGMIHRLSDHLVIEINELLSRIKRPTIFLGDAVSKYRDKILSTLKEKAFFPNSSFFIPKGVSLALLGLHKLRGGNVDDAFSLRPFYVQKAQAEIKWEMGKLKDYKFH